MKKLNINYFIEDGVHPVVTSEGVIQCRTRGLKKCAPGDKLLVKFSGAVINRAGKKGPFFFGLGMSEKLDYPIISFSDPALELSRELIIGWYAGYEGFENLPNRIAQILDEIVASLGVKLVIFGGSGGGFATLAVTSLMKSHACALIWNPQTSISAYSEVSVNKYLALALPSFSGIDASNYQKLMKSGVMHDLTRVVIPSNVNVIYLQNLSDWHLQAHCEPFFLNRASHKIENLPCYNAKNILLCVGDWGGGHVAPPKDVIKLFLSKLVVDDCIENVVYEVMSHNESSAFFPDLNL